MTPGRCIQNFHARNTLQPGSPPRLIVTGEVETPASNKQPVLTRAEPQGTVAEQLILDLAIVETGGEGTQDVAFRRVRHEEPAGKGRYTSVLIRWGLKSIATLHVTEAH